MDKVVRNVQKALDGIATVTKIERPSGTYATQIQDIEGQCHCDPDDDEPDRIVF